jgi:hypothetical protein
MKKKMYRMFDWEYEKPTDFISKLCDEDCIDFEFEKEYSDEEKAAILKRARRTALAVRSFGMTDPLYFVTAISNTRNMVGVGNIQSANAIDLWANTGADWVQLNYANTNFVYADALGSYLQSDYAAVNAFGDGTIQLATSNGKSMSVIVGTTPVFQVASNNDVFSTGTYFGVIDKVDGGVFT